MTDSTTRFTKKFTLPSLSSNLYSLLLCLTNGKSYFLKSQAVAGPEIKFPPDPTSVKSMSYIGSVEPSNTVGCF